MEAFSRKTGFGLLVSILLLSGSLYSCQKAGKNAAGESVVQSENSELMQTLTDDGGRKVAVPKKPKRIIGGHDAIIALPLYEMNMPIVGTWLRKDIETGEEIVFALKELFGKTPAQAGIGNIGGGDGVDFEKVRSMKPDLFIDKSIRSYMAVEKFEKIAPVYTHNYEWGADKSNDANYNLANLFGGMDGYNKANAKYQKRLAEVKARLPFDPATKTFIIVGLWDKMYAGNVFGGTTRVMRDLKFKVPEFLYGKGEFPLSSEDMNNLNQDIIILGSGHKFEDRSKEATNALLSKIVPGWDKIIDRQKIVYVDSVNVMTLTFASAMNTLDYLEEYFADKSPN